MAGKSKDERRQSVRNQIQETIEKAEAERAREHFNRRIDVARTGVRAYQDKQYPQAVAALTTYLKALEDFKRVPEGGLTPNHFDPKVDLPELLLISGIYWDLAKLFDRTKSPERVRDFRLYLQKYVQFSKGLPYAPLAAETLRKYIAVEKPVHRAEFKSAYRQLTDGKCFIATSLVDLCAEPTLPLLREFRDRRLLASGWGRGFTRLYYWVGPALAWALDRAPERVRSLVAQGLDRLARRV